MNDSQQVAETAAATTSPVQITISSDQDGNAIVSTEGVADQHVPWMLRQVADTLEARA